VPLYHLAILFRTRSRGFSTSRATSSWLRRARSLPPFFKNPYVHSFVSTVHPILHNLLIALEYPIARDLISHLPLLHRLSRLITSFAHPPQRREAARGQGRRSFEYAECGLEGCCWKGGGVAGGDDDDVCSRAWRVAASWVSKGTVVRPRMHTHAFSHRARLGDTGMSSVLSSSFTHPCPREMRLGVGAESGRECGENGGESCFGCCICDHTWAHGYGLCQFSHSWVYHFHI
jgi:hypothetical protein